METEDLQTNGAAIDFVSVDSDARESSVTSNVDTSATNASGSGSGSWSGDGSLTMESITNLHEAGLPLYSNLSIVLPPVAFNGIEAQNETGIFFSFYLIPSLFPESNKSVIVGSPVVSASIAGSEVNNLPSPVIITLQTLIDRVSLATY